MVEEESVGIFQTLWSLCYSTTCCFLLFLLVVWLFKEWTMGIYRNAQFVRMEGKVVVITGGNAGVGFETAKVVANQGAKVIVACRNKERGESATKEIIKATGNSKVIFKGLDLQSLESVRNFAEQIIREEEKIDVLINNAGMSDDRGASSWLKGGNHLSEDKLEIVTQTNHLSHFLLTNLLREPLARANSARVVNLSSAANKSGIIDLSNINYETNHKKEALAKTYANSKLMNILFTVELNKRWSSYGVSSYAVHPGFVRSAFFGNYREGRKQLVEVLSYLLGKSSWQGAQSSLFAAMEPGIEKEDRGLAGTLIADCRRADYLCNKKAWDKVLSEGLWKRSEELVGL